MPKTLSDLLVPMYRSNECFSVKVQTWFIIIRSRAYPSHGWCTSCMEVGMIVILNSFIKELHITPVTYQQIFIASKISLVIVAYLHCTSKNTSSSFWIDIMLLGETSWNSKVASSEEVFKVSVIILVILLGLAFASFKSDCSLLSLVLFFTKAIISTRHDFWGTWSFWENYQGGRECQKSFLVINKCTPE